MTEKSLAEDIKDLANAFITPEQRRFSPDVYARLMHQIEAVASLEQRLATAEKTRGAGAFVHSM